MADALSRQAEHAVMFGEGPRASADQIDLNKAEARSQVFVAFPLPKPAVVKFSFIRGRQQLDYSDEMAFGVRNLQPPQLVLSSVHKNRFRRLDGRAPGTDRRAN